MNQNNKDLTAYCGLYCADCIRFKSEAAVLAKDLLEELNHTGFRKYAKVKRHIHPELEYYEECKEVLSIGV